MTDINYYIGGKTGKITWAASETFDELRGRIFDLGKMEAIEIEKLDVLSLTAKILLSAMAGAIIQHLLDQGFSPETIFETGSFEVK